MSFQVQWSIEGEQQLSRSLRGLSSKVKDFREPFGRAAKNLKNTFERDVFSTRGGVIRERWARLSPYTVAQKARSGYPEAPLIRTGKMKRSFRSIVSTNQAIIYNDVNYFKYHQSNRPRRKLPRRVMMKLADQQKEMIVKEFQSYLRRNN